MCFHNGIVWSHTWADLTACNNYPSPWIQPGTSGGHWVQHRDLRYDSAGNPEFLLECHCIVIWNHRIIQGIINYILKCSLKYKGRVCYTCAAASWPACPSAGKSLWLSLSFNSIKGSFANMLEKPNGSSQLSVREGYIRLYKDIDFPDSKPKGCDLRNLDPFRIFHALSDAGVAKRGGRTSPPHLRQIPKIWQRKHCWRPEMPEEREEINGNNIQSTCKILMAWTHAT